MPENLRKADVFIPWIKAFFHSYGHYVRDWIPGCEQLDYKLKLIYILVTYVLYEALYTCVNVPFGSLSSVY